MYTLEGDEAAPTGASPSPKPLRSSKCGWFEEGDAVSGKCNSREPFTPLTSPPSAYQATALW